MSFASGQTVAPNWAAAACFCFGTLLRATPEQNPFHGVDVGRCSSPEVVDWDKDGVDDLIVGNRATWLCSLGF